MSPKNVDQAAVLEKLAALIEAHEITLFDDEEAKALKQVAAVWRGLESFGMLAGFIRKVAMWLGWAVAFYFVLRGGAAAWVKSLFVNI